MLGLHRTWTWRELDEAVDQAAAVLAAGGIGRGDALGILMTKRPEVVLAFFACARLGAIYVPVNVKLHADQVADQLRTARVSAVVVEPAFDGLLKHLLPLLPKDRPSLFASLSARVGSIGDNQLGGWYSYRASKAALNQLLHTAAIELRRTRPAAICVAIHPGTVDTPLSAPFAKTGLDVQTPGHAAQQLLTTLSSLDLTHSGTFVDQHGRTIPW